MGHTPAGAATRQMVHYAQNKNHGEYLFLFLFFFQKEKFN